MKKFLFTLLALLPIVAQGQDFAGRWGGLLSFNDNKIRLIFQLKAAAEGYTATMDSPDQGVSGIPVEQVRVEGEAIELEMPALKASYKGVMPTPKMIVGTFYQNGLEFPLILAPEKPQKVNRPQEPRAPYPYTVSEVSFPSRDKSLTLNGTLTLPADGKPLAAVILVTGSGTQNRDEEIAQHKPFAVIADYLTRRGIAVLRYDDRGYGLSKEEAAKLEYSTTEDMCLDALGAWDYLRTRPETAKIKCGIIGHSEGGTIAFMAAARERKINFLVSMAGSTLRGDQVLIAQNRTALSGAGLPLEVTEQCLDFLKNIFDFMRVRGLWDLQHNSRLHKTRLSNLPTATKLPLTLRESLLRSYDAVSASPWLYFFLRYDPAEDIIRASRIPMLALNGERDTQVNAEAHLGRLEQLLPTRRLTVKRYPNLNHLFQPCTTGLSNEYVQIEPTIDEEVLSDITQWILSRGIGRK